MPLAPNNRLRINQTQPVHLLHKAISAVTSPYPDSLAI